MIRSALAAVTLLAGFSGPAWAENRPPNFLVIVADDLGYSDLGAFGGEIDTPNLDKLAKEGVRFTGFHTAPTCSPTRSMLLSGTDNHRAGLGAMAERQAPNQVGQAGHEGYLRKDIAALPEILSEGGYRTIISGKWHLGLTPDQDPTARGFQQSFTLLQGAHNHFGKDLPEPGVIYRENGKTVTKLPDNFFSSDTFASKLIGQLNTQRDERPFFALLTFTAPHWPLQAHPQDIAKYQGRYEEGYEILRNKRLKKQIELGLVPASAKQHPLEVAKPWASLTDQEKATARRQMEIYAAMVDNLDKNVGRVIDTLKANGDYENTVILFLADNGAEGTSPDSERFLVRAKGYNNAFENLGTATSYTAYGPGWAQGATTPSRRFKSTATEGGTRTVSFLSGPSVKTKGSIAHNYLNVMDVLPTFLDLAGIPQPQGNFQGRTVQPVRGKSWANWLSGKAPHVYGPDDIIGTELHGTRALRQGDWKVTDIGDGKWGLFNIATDPGETTDLSNADPDRKTRLIKAWDDYAKEVGVVLPQPAWPVAF